MGYAWSRGHTGTTSQGFETDEPDLSELANIDTSRLTELERLAIVARLYHAHEARTSAPSSSGFSRYPGSASSSKTVSEGNSAASEEEDKFMVADDDLSDLTDLESDDCSEHDL